MSSNWVSFLLIAACSLIWGSSFILMKRGSAVFAPEQIAALRLFVAGLTLSPLGFYYLWKKKANYPWAKIIVTALLGSLIPYFLFAFSIADNRMSSATVGVLNALTPLFTLIIGVMFYQTPALWNKWAGIVLGFTGALLIISQKHGSHGHNQWSYGALVVAATFCYGLNANFLKNKIKGLNALEIASMSLGFAAVPSGIYLFNTDFLSRLTENAGGTQAFWAIFVLGAVGTSLALYLFLLLLERSTAVLAASVTYFMPIVSVFWGVFNNEAIGWFHFGGLLFILSGVYLANYWNPNWFSKKSEQRL